MGDNVIEEFKKEIDLIMGDNVTRLMNIEMIYSLLKKTIKCLLKNNL